MRGASRYQTILGNSLQKISLWSFKISFLIFLAANPKAYLDTERIYMDKRIKSANFVSKATATYKTDFEVRIPPLFDPTSSSSTRVIDTRKGPSSKTHKHDYDTGQEYNSVKMHQINKIKGAINDLFL